METQEKLYHVGSLTYTKWQLIKVCGWLLWGDVCYWLMESVIPSILPLKFEKLGASNTAIGLIMATCPMLISGLANPVISFKSDRFRSRLGRRIPYILYTVPFLVVSLIGVGFADKLGFWIHARYGAMLGHMSASSVAVVTIGVFMVSFSFFNTFLNSVFWYLFNDVVPEHLLARLMSWLRVVSLVTCSFYNFFIFQFAGQHSEAIILCASALYFVGFGLVCLNVKEGQYPPPPAYVDGKTGPFSAVKTFAKECHSLTHYCLQFLSSVFSVMAFAVNVFVLFFYKSTGLSLLQIGKIQGCANVAMAILIPLSGWLADRYHPIRVVIAGNIMNVALLLPASMIWLFWHPPGNVAFWIWMVIMVGFSAPTLALMTISDLPLLMRLFPRERFGQFCSANAMWRSAGGIVGGVLAGVFLDLIKHHVNPKHVYYFIPVWQISCYIPASICIILLYRSWKRYGGDEAYVPPMPGCSAGSGGAELEAKDVVYTVSSHDE